MASAVESVAKEVPTTGPRLQLGLVLDEKRPRTGDQAGPEVVLSPCEGDAEPGHLNGAEDARRDERGGDHVVDNVAVEAERAAKDERGPERGRQRVDSAGKRRVADVMTPASMARECCWEIESQRTDKAVDGRARTNPTMTAMRMGRLSFRA